MSLELELGVELGTFHLSCGGVISSDPIVGLCVRSTVVIFHRSLCPHKTVGICRTDIRSHSLSVSH